MSAAFSAIIRVGELVLPEVMVGITEASAMRRPARPWTRRRASTAAPLSSPILQVPTGWKMVVPMRSEEHTSELQSLMRISYAVFCLKKKNTKPKYKQYIQITTHITTLIHTTYDI